MEDWKEIVYEKTKNTSNSFHVKGKCPETGLWHFGRLLSLNVVGNVVYDDLKNEFSITTHLVNPNTICRFLGYVEMADILNTGVKSHHPFFEGDICKGVSNTMEIIWGNNAFRWGSESGMVVNDLDLAYCEVIGNIHD